MSEIREGNNTNLGTERDFGQNCQNEFLAELEALSLEKKNKALKTSKVAQQIFAANSRVN